MALEDSVAPNFRSGVPGREARGPCPGRAVNGREAPSKGDRPVATPTAETRPPATALLHVHVAHKGS